MAARRGDVMRLSRSTFVTPPGTGTGRIVHLGIGAFHRAHQAVYTEDAGDGWRICGVSQRSRDMVDRLGPQDGLYSVLVRGPGGTTIRVIGSVGQVRFAGDDPDAVVARIADPATRIVTLTVTEKGYHHDPATRRLRVDDPEVAQDLAGRAPRTAVGQLARGLAARQDPITVVCCDNLPSNGPLLRGLVEDFCAKSGITLDVDLAFPATMVDRIVPATTAADRDEAERLLGLRDEAVVVTEPFTQWVIEDSFAAERPAWERAGAIITGDVAPYETMKLRLLNGSHSMIAYLGALAGFELRRGRHGPARPGGRPPDGRRDPDADHAGRIRPGAVPDVAARAVRQSGAAAPHDPDRHGRLAEVAAAADPGGQGTARRPLGGAGGRRLDALRVGRPG